MEAKNARDYTADLMESLKGKRPEFNQSNFKRYAREFKTAIEQDKTPPEVLEKARAYIAEHWAEKRLTVQDAIGGVQRRSPVAQSASDRTEGYEHLFELSARQNVLVRLIEKKTPKVVITMVRENPGELKEYLEGMVSR